jgi:hypothetical protein
MGERAAGADPVVDEREAEVLADQWGEAIGLDAIGDLKAAVRFEPAAREPPAPSTFADEQRHVGEIAREACEGAADAAA